ncbi:uncharacterized protein EAE97_009592 [Botrytis byssoidea]|uniref:Uncharacterized protein n=1 Tax=Botrytis byssoidea TaxID=139641 RepID=A0A9P5LMF3_9HELO|nr:uncharacterized protein EAE97_009592 [Botrytis byssoidea]KAF7929995.1 hypothetical protein EAE97_009592 [Botrytis byssoidea]
MVCFCIGAFFSKLFHKRHQKSIQRQAEKDAQIKVEEETKLNTGMNARIEACTESGPLMREITKEEYDRGVINYREHEPITITVNDVHGVTHIQEVINFNPSIPSNEVANPERIETTGKELSSGSQEMVKAVEDGRMAVSKELGDRKSLQMVEETHTAITKKLSATESLEMVAIDMDGTETRIKWQGVITPA